MFAVTPQRTLAALLVVLLLPVGASALTLEDLNNGASFSTDDGTLTFENWVITLPDEVDGDPNAIAGIPLDIFQVETFEDGFGFEIVEINGPIVAFGDQIGNMQISFDVVTNGVFIDGVGLQFTATAQGTGAVAVIDELVTGSSEDVVLQAILEDGGAQSPTDFAAFSERQTGVTVMKDIVVDVRDSTAFVAQISQFEQSFDTSPIPEPTAAALFGIGALVVRTSIRRRRS